MLLRRALASYTPSAYSARALPPIYILLMGNCMWSRSFRGHTSGLPANPHEPLENHVVVVVVQQLTGAET